MQKLEGEFAEWYNLRKHGQDDWLMPLEELMDHRESDEPAALLKERDCLRGFGTGIEMAAQQPSFGDEQRSRHFARRGLFTQLIPQYGSWSREKCTGSALWLNARP